MDRFSSAIKSSLPALVVGLVLVTLYLQHFMFRAFVEIDFETYLRYKAPVQVFWADRDETFSKKRLSTHWIFNTQNLLQMRVGDLGDGAQLRIDPLQYKGHAKIKRIRIEQSGYKPLTLDDAESLTALEPVNHIKSAVYQDGGLVITTTGGDSQLLLHPELVRAETWPWHHLINVLGIMLASLALLPALSRSFSGHAYVPVGLTVVLVLATVMVSVSQRFTHPDEATHTRATNYYQNYNLPPKVDGPEIAPTYSAYGNSRLYGYEIYYFFSGLFKRLTEPLHIPAYMVGRLFSLLLLLGLALMAYRLPEFRVVAAPLLITPQIWYFFSYANSDSYSVFVSTVLAWLAADSDSPLNRFLVDREPSAKVLKTIALGLFLGGMLFTKLNYYTVILFVGSFYVWKYWRGDFVDRRLFFRRAIAVLAVGMLLAGCRLVWDGVNNDWERGERIHKMWEKHAIEAYKPSTPLENKHPEMFLRERGTSIDDMLNVHHWGGKSLLSAFGGYGHTEYFARPAYFNWMSGLGLMFMALAALALLMRGNRHIQTLFLLTVFFCFLVVAISFVTSWIRILQPQGRYLAPILPILGVLYYQMRPYIFQWVSHILILGMFSLSVYSFAFVGIAEIPKG